MNITMFIRMVAAFANRSFSAPLLFGTVLRSNVAGIVLIAALLESAALELCATDSLGVRPTVTLMSFVTKALRSAAYSAHEYCTVLKMAQVISLLHSEN